MKIITQFTRPRPTRYFLSQLSYRECYSHLARLTTFWFFPLQIHYEQDPPVDSRFRPRPLGLVQVGQTQFARTRTVQYTGPFRHIETDPFVGYVKCGPVGDATLISMTVEPAERRRSFRAVTLLAASVATVIALSGTPVEILSLVPMALGFIAVVWLILVVPFATLQVGWYESEDRVGRFVMDETLGSEISGSDAEELLRSTGSKLSASWQPTAVR